MKPLKTIGIATALVLLLTVASLAALPTASARDITTYAIITVSPNPVGAGQSALITMWVSMPPPTAAGAQGERWQNFRVNVTKPDGSKETLGPFSSDPVGMYQMRYTPTSIGKYTFQFYWPGQTSTTGNYYTSSVSNIYELTVQEDWITEWPDPPLPTDYWTRPIYGTNRNWWSISGNWLMAAYDTTFRFFDQGSAFAPYNAAPDSAHIMWTRPITDGGLIGGEYASTAYYTGMSYEMKLTGMLVINGRYYYNLFPAGQGQGYAVLDLRTGEELWRNENERLDIGQIYDYESPNQHGGQAYLWSLGSTTYKMFDAFTGKQILTIANVTSGTARFGSDGSLLTYTLQGAPVNCLTLWNSSKCIGPAGAAGSEAWQWRPWTKGTIDWKRGIEWNVSFPALPLPPMSSLSIQASITDPDVILAYGYIMSPQIYSSGTQEFLNIGFDAKTGRQLWVKNRTMQSETELVWQMLDYSLTGDKDADIYVYHARDSMRSYGFDLKTGEQLWVTEPLKDPWGFFPAGQVTAYGKYYLTGYSGKVYCYDLKTGKFLWEYSTGNSGLETPYGTWPFYSGLLIADGKIFASTGEHSPSTPLWRGEKLHVINATTGQPLWNITGWFISHGNVVADGYFVGLNGYDNQLYCFGKGPSATTVSAPLTAITRGQSIMLTGSVTDQSPAQKGTACVSDESMSAWMEYLHMQHPCPADVKGVEVSLDTLDPNGNFVHIGTATTDTSGNFGYLWEPEVPGKYMVIATFAGSKSYGSSTATTYVGVVEAPPASPPPEYPQPIDHTWTIIGMGIVLLIAILLVGLLLLRRK
ncbi:MAG: PQQ-binding-like beta-propeller repeat protein [Candidatus Bathyarchaeota archaeon]|nr:PQQ-binding-like beta-propeller repeat protein [Candidatus Bathyarchaeota archaeon]